MGNLSMEKKSSTNLKNKKYNLYQHVDYASLIHKSTQHQKRVKSIKKVIKSTLELCSYYRVSENLQKEWINLRYKKG